jgi:hypothetical protein
MAIKIKNMDQIKRFINKLGLPENLRSESTDYGFVFYYETELSNQIVNKNIIIPFIFYNDANSLFNYHLIEWNKNELDYFIAVGNNKSYIIKAKEKPDETIPLKKEVIVDENGFDFGINTPGYDGILDIPFSKENLDNSVFFDFVLRKQKEIKNEVDKHLL